jgi:APA family basic amino acid/polyamine antiporter
VGVERIFAYRLRRAHHHNVPETTPVSPDLAQPLCSRGTIGRKPALLRILGVLFGLAVAIGSMIGAGILRTPGSVAAAVPDIALILALWVFGAVHSALSANVVAELFTAIPRAGGVYIPVRRAFGDAGAMMVGWTDMINSAAATSALALAGVDFLALAWPRAGERPLSLAVILIAGLFAVNAMGVREGRAAQIAATAVKLAILAVIAVGALFLPAAAAPAAASISPALGVAGLIAAYQLISGAYSGWPNPIYFVEEDVAPSRNLPRALFGGIIAVGLVYLAVNAAVLHVFSVADLGRSQIPVGEIIRRLVGPAGPLVLGLTGFVLILGCCNAGLMVAPRIVFGLARDKLFPSIGAQVSRGGTPQIGLALITITSALLVLTGSFEAAFRVVAATGVLAILALDVSLFVLRWREPGLNRPYRAALYPFLPALALLLDGAFFAAILWFDPLSGAITAATLVAATIAWFMMRRMRRAAALSRLAD